MDSITAKIITMIEILQGTLKDATKFEEKGNNTAGTRVRKDMQELIKMAKDVRITVQEIKKS